MMLNRTPDAMESINIDSRTKYFRKNRRSGFLIKLNIGLVEKLSKKSISSFI